LEIEHIEDSIEIIIPGNESLEVRSDEDVMVGEDLVRERAIALVLGSCAYVAFEYG